MSETRLRLGETLIEAKLLEPEQLEIALEIQKKRQLRLGTILLQEGFVTEPQLVQALSHQLSIPWVSLWHIDVPDELLKLVPVSVAEEFFLIPIYVRSTIDGHKALYVAMNDPTDDAALRFVSAAAGMPVKPMIAGPSDIAEAIRVYYYGQEDEEKPVAASCPPRMSTIPPPAGRTVKNIRPLAAAPEPDLLSDEDAEDDSGELSLSDAAVQILSDESDESEEPTPVPQEPQAAPQQVQAREQPTAPQRVQAPERAAADRSPPEQTSTEDATPTWADGQAEPDSEPGKEYPTRKEAERYMWGIGQTSTQKGFSMTLLDGTTVTFGGASKKRPEQVHPKEDLVAALRALAQGASVDDLLPTDRWERYMAALLEVLFKKHLVLFDEFEDALKKE